MSRKWITNIIIVALIFSAALVAYAGLHFVGSSAFGFGSLRASANIAGFGSDTDTVSVTLTATGTNMIAMCENKGGNRAPGQNPLNVSVNESQTVTPDRNGKATVDFHVSLLPTSAKAAGCPNNNWTVTDLYGTLYVTMTAVNQSNGDTQSQNFVCTVNEAQREVTCS